MHLVKGTLLDGRYEIKNAIGHGGMGSVFLAQQLGIERRVAIKVLLQGYNSTPEDQGRFEREALALSALKHRNIVSIYAYGMWDIHPYTVMEYISGSSLADKLRSGSALPAAEALHIVKQLCEGIEHAHSHGIVHRDLKPSNIMLPSKNGETVVKIVDFGLARLMPEFGRDMQKLTKTGYALGTALYMSPEQCIGAQADHRADIYAAGAILYHCITGKPAFAAENEFATMQSHLIDAPPAVSLSSAKTDFRTQGLQSIVYKAMAKRPEDRYQSAKDMLEDIDKVENGLGSELTGTFKMLDPKARSNGKTASSKLKAATVATLIVGLVISAVAICYIPDSLLTQLSLQLCSEGEPGDRLGAAARFCTQINRPIAAYKLLQQAAREPINDHTVKKFELLMEAQNIIAATDLGKTLDNREKLYGQLWQQLMNELGVPLGNPEHFEPMDPYSSIDMELPDARSSENAMYRPQGSYNNFDKNKLLDMTMIVFDRITKNNFHTDGNWFPARCRWMVILLSEQGRYDDALVVQNWAMQASKSAWGKQSPYLLQDLNGLGSIYWDLSRKGKNRRDHKLSLKKSMNFYMEAEPIADATNTNKPFYSNVADTYAGLSCCYFAKHDTVSGKLYMDKAINALQHVSRPDPGSNETDARGWFVRRYSKRLLYVNPHERARLKNFVFN